MSGRVSYIEAATAMRDVIVTAAAIRPRLRGRDWAVLGAVLSLTGCYSKTEDEVHAAQVAAVIGIDVSHVRKSLALLARENVIEWKPNRGSHRRTRLALKGRRGAYDGITLKGKGVPVSEADGCLSSKADGVPATEKGPRSSSGKGWLAEAMRRRAS